MIIIEIWKDKARWAWAVMDGQATHTMENVLIYGTSPDYHQACEQARIAWEQHSEGDRE